MDFTEEEIERSKAAMQMQAPIGALKLIASGRVVVSLSKDGRDVLMEEIDGTPVFDPEYPERKMGLSGAWPLFRAGMIDKFCVVTEAGRRALETATS